MRHPAVEAWEARLRAAFGRVDAAMEAKYGARLSRDPRRPPAGGARHEDDGVFNFGASFTAGLGSRFGRGYVVELSIRSIRPPPESLRRAIEVTAIRQLRHELRREFPKTHLRVVHDGPVWKIVGDLGLGHA